MNEENTQTLYREFPKLYREFKNERSLMKYGFETGDGWYRLIYDLSREIEAEARRLRLSPESENWPAAIQ